MMVKLAKKMVASLLIAMALGSVYVQASAADDDNPPNSSQGYLYCASADDYKWAKWKETLNWIKNEGIGGNYNDFVLLKLSKRKSSYGIVAIVEKPPQLIWWPSPGTKTAKESCDAIVKVCTEQYGGEYRYVGISGADFNDITWYNFSVNNEKTSSGLICPGKTSEISESNIRQSPTELFYDVSCVDTPNGNHEPTSFRYSQNNVWSNGSVSYKSYVPYQNGKWLANKEELDDDIGTEYCSREK